MKKSGGISAEGAKKKPIIEITEDEIDEFALDMAKNDNLEQMKLLHSLNPINDTQMDLE
jgi:hypothetical protein